MKLTDTSIDKIQTPVEGLSLLITIVSKWLVAVRFAGGGLLFERRFRLRGVSGGEDDNSTDDFAISKRPFKWNK
jgi:hypothetical protein